jgi:tRNA dimethylallyltransferase
MSEQNINLITILGPTATGKTNLAAALAYRLKSAVISADSRQVYKEMSIGTGKDLADFNINGKVVPYYLIDICNAGQKYNVFEYQHDFFKVFEKLQADGITPILCGGTGLYIEAVVRAYKLVSVPPNEELRNQLADLSMEQLIDYLNKIKPKRHNKSDIDTRKRIIRAIEIEEYNLEHPAIKTNFPSVNSLYVGILFDREVRRARITERLRSRLKEGMIEEVQSLLNNGIAADDLIYYGLEYKFVTLYLTGKLTYDEMFSQLEVAIHQFAKRQMTWFRKMEREGFDIHWIDGFLSIDEKIEIVLNLLKK